MEGHLTSPLRCYYDLELPSEHRRRKGWPLLVALHGYEGNKESMMRLAARIAAGKMIVISLQGPNQFFLRNPDDPQSIRVGFGWGTSWRGLESVALHHHNVRELIGMAVRDHGADAKRVFLLSFSQPTSYNYRFAFTHPGKIRGLVAVCGGVPGDWEQNPNYRSTGTHVLHIAATDDQWYKHKHEQFRRQLPRFAESLDFRFYQSPHRFPRRAIPHIRRWIEKHAA